MKTTNPPIRFRHKTVPLSVEEAGRERDEQILNAIAGLEGMLESLRELLKSDLPKTKTIMEQVEPGEQGYENAAYQCSYTPGRVFRVKRPPKNARDQG